MRILQRRVNILPPHLQARTQNLEAQIAATSTELHRLQTALRQLEDRNVLLETLATDDTGDSQVTVLAAAVDF